MKPIAIPALLSALAAIAATGPAHAAVSGFYDSAEKIGMILGSNLVADALRQAPIWSITNTGTRKDGAGEWLVRTQECDLKLYLVPVLPNGPGKTTYTLEPPGQCE